VNVPGFESQQVQDVETGSATYPEPDSKGTWVFSMGKTAGA